MPGIALPISSRIGCKRTLYDASNDNLGPGAQGLVCGLRSGEGGAKMPCEFPLPDYFFILSGPPRYEF